MDQKIIRAGVNSALIALLSGIALGTFGGWSALFDLAPNFFAVLIVAIVFSVLLGYIYSYWFADFLPGTALMKGVLFGILVWIVLLILGGITDFFKEAVYAGNDGKILFLALVNHIVWGSFLSSFLEGKS